MLKLAFIYLLGYINIFNLKAIRKSYWNLRAIDIDEKWGCDKGDYPIIREIIELTKPQRVLDVGCGSGRLFELFSSMDIDEIIGQDISEKALELANTRIENNKTKKIHLTSTPISSLQYPYNYIKLSISNRTLSAISPDKIEKTVKNLCNISNFIYINEMTDSDYIGYSPYWFKHDYIKIMTKNNMKIVKKGVISGSKQTYYLFEKLM